MKAVRAFFFANWKNKGVALFFAVSIWFVAYQSEIRTFITTLKVNLLPLNQETMIAGAEVGTPDGGFREFNGEVVVNFSGPRKEIDQLKQRLNRDYDLWIPEDRKEHEFSPQDFGFPRDGITITNLTPSSVKVQIENLVEKPILDLKDKIQVEPSIPGYDVTKEILKPKTQSLRLRMPKSLVDAVSVKVVVNMPYDRNEIEGLFDVQIVSDMDQRVSRMVQIWDFEQSKWVNPSDAPHIHLKVRLVANYDFLEREAVKLTFRLPLMKYPHKIVLMDAPGGMIPVKFFGPKDRIKQLRETFQADPGFTISVPPPSGFEPDKETIYTFTEDDLEVPGFPAVRVQQHDNRKRDHKTAWLFTVKVLPDENAKSG
jgi:hypothetical protein